ncbi:MAG: hypothetical protein N2517_09195 [Ignavibacteria bacterium]|nr:hypothetical protein [Ignavibacteria bacterium]
MNLYTHKQDACATICAGKMPALPFGEARMLLLLRTPACVTEFPKTRGFCCWGKCY